MITPEQLEKLGYELIPISDINIKYDPKVTIGYDFTVQDNYTFCTHDGVFVQDTLAVYAPLSKQSQQEIKDRLITSYNSTGIGQSNFGITMEMLTGLFTLTYDKNKDKHKGVPKKVTDISTIYAMDINNIIEINYKGEKRVIRVGSIIFNELLPKWYEYIDKPVAKSDITKILKTCLNKNQQDYITTLDNMMRSGFYYATIYPKTFSLDLLKINPKLQKLKDKLSEEQDVNKQMDIVNEMEDILLEYLKETDNDIYYMIASGASKGKNQIRQLMVSKGLVSDPDGNILPPIIQSLSDGYDHNSYFEASAGARKGVIDRALGTADGGYVYRIMIFAIGNVEADINNGNCGTKKTINIKLTPNLYKRMAGRYILDEKGKIIPLTEEYIGKVVRLRTPIYCQSKVICKTCYGELLKQINSKAVGIIAAGETLSLSEKIMKCSTGIIETEEGFESFEDLWERL